MAKEFKDYDKKYRHLIGTLLPHEPQPAQLKVWPYMADFIPWKKPDHATIAAAVYGSEVWQMFRVSLKGWSTEHKLGRLAYRHDRMICRRHASYVDTEVLRINNYIDSMKRSGLINQKGEVIK